MKNIAHYLEDLDSDCSRDVCKTAVLVTARTLTKIFYKLPFVVPLCKASPQFKLIFLREEQSLNTQLKETDFQKQTLEDCPVVKVNLSNSSTVQLYSW
jgi:hypothetical protein